MEIKVGDKVRIANNAPEEFERFKGDDMNYEVVRINPSKVIIQHKLAAGLYGFTLSVPCKYLVKVDAEAFRLADVVSDSGLHQDNYLNEDKKEAEFKVGDRVIVHYPSGDMIGHIQEEMLDGTYDIDYGGGCTGHNITRSQIELYTTPEIKIGDRVRCKTLLRLANSTDNDFIGIVTDAVTDGENGWFSVRMDNGAVFQTYHESDLELIEPTEQTEAEKKPYDGISEETANEISNMLEAYAKALSGIADSFDWQRYEADLAKEVALKVANKYNDPEQAAEYAVKVAKAVVEGLKRK